VVPIRESSPSSFEKTVKHLKLCPEDHATSSRLKEWVRENKNHRYIPSELLAVLGLQIRE
jgi:hypothetical protein